MNASNSQPLEDLREISSILPVKIFSYGDNSFKGNLNRLEAVYHIDNVSFADQGEYICEAFDEHGKVRKGAFLKVFNGKFYFSLTFQHERGWHNRLVSFCKRSRVRFQDLTSWFRLLAIMCR